MSWVVHVACIEEMINTKLQLGCLEQKRPVEKLRHRLDDNIKMDLKPNMELLFGLHLSGQEAVAVIMFKVDYFVIR